MIKLIWNSNSTPPNGRPRLSRFENQAKSWHLGMHVSRCRMMKRQLSLGCPMFSPSNKHNRIKKNRKKILVKNRNRLGQNTQDTIFVRIEDWGLRICFEIENRYMQCCRNRNYKNFLLRNHGAKLKHQDAIPQTGRSRFGASLGVADRDRLLGTDQNRWNDFEISLMQCCR